MKTPKFLKTGIMAATALVGSFTMNGCKGGEEPVKPKENYDFNGVASKYVYSAYGSNYEFRYSKNNDDYLVRMGLTNKAQATHVITVSSLDVVQNPTNIIYKAQDIEDFVQFQGANVVITAEPIEHDPTKAGRSKLAFEVNANTVVIANFYGTRIYNPAENTSGRLSASDMATKFNALHADQHRQKQYYGDTFVQKLEKR